MLKISIMTVQQLSSNYHLISKKAIGLQLDTITYRNLSTSLKVNGTLELPPQNKAQVSVLAGGVVKSISIRG
jgi:cobalt-zinc-cadmium efflux system membrane fusion protein